MCVWELCMEMDFIKRNGKVFLQRHIIGAACIGLGLLYIPAFVYGFFWLWVVPFTAFVTLLLKAEMVSTYHKVIDIIDPRKKSKAATFRFLKSDFVVSIIGALPFILMLWLLKGGYIKIDGVGAVDKSLFKSVLYFTPSPNALRIVETTRYDVGYIQVLCGCAFYMFLSFVSFTAFAFREIGQVMKLICNKDHSGELEIYPHYQLHLNASKYQTFFELLFLVLLIITYIAGINEFMKVSYTTDVLSCFCMVCSYTTIKFSNWLVGWFATPFKSIQW